MAEDTTQKKTENTTDKKGQSPPPKTGGGEVAGAVGSGLLEFLGAHKIAIIVVGGIAVVIVFVIAMQGQNATTSGNTNTANQQGSLANSGYQDAGTAYALTQLTSQLDSIQ